MEQIEACMVDGTRVGQQEGTRGGTSTDGCGGMVGWDCEFEIRTETGFELGAWSRGGCAACRA